MVRAKHRYILLRIIPVNKKTSILDCTIKSTDLYTAIFSKVKKLHGDFGIASIRTGFVCKYCNGMTGVAIIKIRFGAYEFVSSTMPLIKEIGNHAVQLHTIRTTSSLHRAYKCLKIYQQRQLEKLWNLFNKDHQKIVQPKFENLTVIEELLLSEKQSHTKKK